MADLPQHTTDFLTLLAELTKETTIARRAELLFARLDGYDQLADPDADELEARSATLADIATAAATIDLGEHSEESIKAAVRQFRKVLRGLDGDSGEAL